MFFFSFLYRFFEMNQWFYLNHSLFFPCHCVLITILNILSPIKIMIIVIVIVIVGFHRIILIWTILWYKETSRYVKPPCSVSWGTSGHYGSFGHTKRVKIGQLKDHKRNGWNFRKIVVFMYYKTYLCQLLRIRLFPVSAVVMWPIWCPTWSPKRHIFVSWPIPISGHFRFRLCFCNENTNFYSVHAILYFSVLNEWPETRKHRMKKIFESKFSIFRKTPWLIN